MTLNCFIPIFHQMFERRKLLSVVGAYKLLVNNAILLKILLGNHQFRFNFIILRIVKRNPLFLHEIEWKNNGFLFTTPNIIILHHGIYYRFHLYLFFSLSRF